jgi:hypothetical protein
MDRKWEKLAETLLVFSILAQIAIVCSVTEARGDWPTSLITSTIQNPDALKLFFCVFSRSVSSSNLFKIGAEKF